MKYLAVLLILALIEPAHFFGEQGYPGHVGPGYSTHGRPGYQGYGGPGYPGHGEPDSPAHGRPVYPGNGGPGYPGHEGPWYPWHRASVYPRDRGPGYPGNGYGYGPGYREYDPYYGRYLLERKDKPLDELDKLYSRLNNVQDELKTGSEILAALEARLALSKKVFDHFLDTTNPDARTKDNNQNNAMTRLEMDLDGISDDMDELEATLNTLDSTNTNAVSGQNLVSDLLNQEDRKDKEQAGQIAGLLSTVRHMKEKLIKVMDNEFLKIDKDVSVLDGFVGVLGDKEKTRKCEVGQVTLDADERKSEYLFQTDFLQVPQVLYSVCGFNFDLDAQPHRDGDQDGFYYKEPNAMGLFVSALSSKTGVTFELFDQSFGDTSVETTDVCFQACTIGPGNTLIDMIP